MSKPNLIDRRDVEEAIMILADIIDENRCLKMELKHAKAEIAEYRRAVAEHTKAAEEDNRLLLEFMLSGCITEKERKIHENRENDLGTAD